MASGGGDIRAGKAFVELYVKNNAFLKGLAAASARMKSFGLSAMKVGGIVATAGASVLTAMGAAVKHFMDAGGALGDLRNRTRISAETLSELAYAAKLSGASIEDVEKAILNAKSKGFGTDFIKLAANIAAIEDPTKRAQKAMEVFGKKTGHLLLPMIEDLDRLRSRARDLGVGASEEDVQLAEKLGDRFDDLKTSIMATVFSIGAALAPTLIEAADTVIGIVVTVGKWVRENKQLIVTIAKIAAGVVAAGVAIAAIGAIIFGVGAVLGAIPVILSALVVAFKVAFLAIGMVIGLVLSPIGLVIAALLIFTDTAKHVAKLAGEAFTEIKEVAFAAFGGMADALMAGEFLLAGKILWTAMKILWVEGTSWLLNKWTDLRTKMSEVFIRLVAGIKLIWIGLQGFLVSAFFGTLRGLVEGIRGALGDDLFSQLDDALGGALSGATIGINVAEGNAREGIERRRDSVMRDMRGALEALHNASDEEKARRQAQVDILKKQLDALNKQAAAARAAKDVLPGQDNYVPGGGEDGMGGVGGAVSGTFSAPGAVALGSMAGPAAEERRDRKEMIRLQREHAAASRQAARALAGAAAMGFI